MPPRKKATTGPTPVDAITYNDKRTNLPTADAHDFVDPEIENPFVFKYPRPLYSPQLVWRGKEEQDLAEYLEGNAPPIYIQEKIDPRVLIENLRRTSARPEEEPELTLFDAFDGLPELDLVDFYQHEANWSNRMILGDSLNVMASLAERERLRGKIQMIYLDPPYGIKFGSNWQVSARKRDVKDGKLEDATREVEQIKAFRDTWEYGINSYLTYLRDRMTAARELLTESGSVFVQIGDENVHLVRSLMDEVCGSENFISQITFKTTSGATSDFIGGTTDYLLWYAKDRRAAKFRPLYRPRHIGEGGDETYSLLERSDGTRVRLRRTELASYRPEDGRLYRLQLLTSQSQGRAKGEGAASWFPVQIDGRTFRPSMQARWKTNEVGMARLIAARRVEPSGNNINYVRFHDDFPAIPLNNLWDDTQSGSAMNKVYVVQTNSRVIERCMLMCTDPGDLVLDPTCGSGTTAFVAEQWGRRWITVDTSRVALALARQRLMGGRFPWYLLADSVEGRVKESELSGTPLPPAATTGDIRHGFVYERVQHITLKSIANNPDIRKGMSRAEIDAAIKRHAEYELLYDRPHEDKRKVRVAGPFTVESLSPHRSLAFAGSAVDDPEAICLNDEGAFDGSAEFEQTVIANLRAAGIQNGRKNERLTFDSVEPYASPYIQAVGIREDATNGMPKRVGITVGPQYGTVGPSFIKDAAREANRTREADLLCVLAFAFDPAVLGTADDDYVTSEEGFANVAAERRLGRVPVLLVRMNADLVMGEELKKTGAGNLFTVFGEPDIEIKREDDELRVLLHGVDVYDPNTGDLRSDTTDQIALWMIDTAYNGESFFVRHCYFTGGQDPYKRLKAALKADIDPDAWESLHGSESRPFARPDTGKIAVKVINDYGDEVMKVFTV
ncbi:site-specific DNA-methyltransferase [Micromonospora sp. C95]|uniref:site-specific DNA-methyltransferase n=1 Tax=Micromonospora sp. C95 TaxID=2824882 RepID=UPI001B358BFA|nr:site-specific DNA-methyltransferase [Micromonospora sp. C95]MBQ1027475.1 site-specific DNA-methyltransferase [Micromonospora sp. C95]